MATFLETDRLVLYGFTELRMEWVTANTMAVNTCSRCVMEKAGPTFVRAFAGDWPEPITGSEHGEVEYALTRAEWQRQASSPDPAPPSGAERTPGPPERNPAADAPNSTAEGDR